MKLRHLSLPIMIIGALLGGKTHAAPLTPEEALGRVFTDSPRSTKGMDRSGMKLLSTVRTARTEAEVYLFTSGKNGYLVVSGDDCAPALLGYGDIAPASEADIPPAMQYWLGEYGRQIAAARDAGVEPGASLRDEAPKEERKAIGPLLATKWDQESPYNNLSPIVEEMRCMTGCVATAMAQVMNYHQWPPKGTGSKTYTFTPYQAEVDDMTLTCDFASVEFDWDNMLDSYKTTYSETEASAVAQLMYAAGVSVDMMYGPYVSGAVTADVAGALLRFFDYDRSITVRQRKFYDSEEWEDMIYTQLSGYGPVQYAAANNSGGHSFVCDGYSSDGYFHFNWGWGGMSDGYFLLNALEPSSQGIGGSSGAYSYRHLVVANIKPSEQGSQYTFNLVLYDDFGISQPSVPTGGKVTVTSPNTEEYLSNLSPYEFTGLLGMKIAPYNDTESEAVYIGSEAPSGLDFLSFVTSYGCDIPEDLKDGQYKVTPAARDSQGEWHDIRVSKNNVKELLMTVDNGICTFQPGPSNYIKVKDIVIATDIYLGNQFKLSAIIDNPCEEEFQGTISPVLLDDEDNVVALGEFHTVSLKGGESQNMDYTGAFDSYEESMTTGSYRICFIDYDTQNEYSEPYTVMVHGLPESTVLTASELTVTGQDSGHVQAGPVQFTAEVKCDEGYYGGPFKLYIYGPDTDENGYMSVYDVVATNPLFIGSGESGTVSADVTLRGSEEGAYYEVILVDRNIMPVNDWKSFTVFGPSTGIEDVLSDTPVIELSGDFVHITGIKMADVDVYSIDGAKTLSVAATTDADLSSLPHGMYLVVITTPDNFRTARKIIR